MVTTTFASPLGDILLAADAHGLTGLWFDGQAHFGSTLIKEGREDRCEHLEGADAVSGSVGVAAAKPTNTTPPTLLSRAWARTHTSFF